MRLPVLLALCLLIPGHSLARDAEVVRPGPGALSAALDAAAPGATLRLAPGLHDGGVRLDRPVTLLCDPGAVIDAGGAGSALTVTAPDVTVKGCEIRGSGSDHDALDSGVRLLKGADRALVEGCRILGNLYGVDVHGAKDAMVRGNLIVGRADARMNDRGNGVYVWNAPGSAVVGNDIRLGRDGIFVNTSRKNSFRDNRFSGLRFAVHWMYANDSEAVGNLSTGNHLGFAIMFSRKVRVEGNASLGDRDQGIMLNYANQGLIAGNWVRGAGQRALFIYNSHRNRIARNAFEASALGVHFTAGSERNRLWENSFAGNRTQVKYVGAKWVDWSVKGRGNHWSDHAAFDLDGDGIADAPYRPNDAMDRVLWTQPAARLLLGSPAVQLTRWAQRSFPAALPGGVIDRAPLMRPAPVAAKERFQ